MSVFFCEENRERVNTFHENDLFRARWDQIPVALGHAEVVPKRHVQYFDQLTDEEKQGLLKFASEVIAIIQRVDLLATEYEKLLTDATDYVKLHLEKAFAEAKTLTQPPDAFNHGLNDGQAAGQTVPHFHYHLIPRWKGDIENPRGGIRRIFGEDEYSKS